VPDERLNYLSVSIESITKWLSYEEVIKDYADKNVGKKYYGDVFGS
jgi:hypothetical protein